MIWINGVVKHALSQPEYNDQSIYEVIRLIDGIPVFFDLHMNRLFQSLKAKAMTPEYSAQTIYNAIRSVADFSECNVRLEIWKENDVTMHRIFNVPFQYPSQEQYLQGVKTVTAEISRPDPHIKMYRSKYIEEIQSIKASSNAFEVLLCSANGYVTEGSRSNIFFIKNDTVISPKSEDVLLGISRAVLISVIQENNIKFEERDVHVSEIDAFSSVFLTGTSLHLLPVSALNGVPMHNKDSQFVNRLLGLFKSEVLRNITQTRRQYTMTSVKDRFLKYVSFNTESNPDSASCPSTESQRELGKYLVDEMKAIGVSNVVMDDNGYVYGEIPAHPNYLDAPRLGLIAHMDTSPDLSGKNVCTKVIENYQGGPILLNEPLNIWLKSEEFHHLNHYIGKDIIVTDGTTLLGADNKAGIAEILTTAQMLIENPEIPHGAIKIGFTPDEEIGRGADLFNLEHFNADFAYTVDGGELGEIEFENFNAASAKVQVKGVNIHPGSAKGKMKNAVLIAMEFNAMLPPLEVPHNTEHYEGFSHLNDIKGNVELSEMLYIIRDHDLVHFEKKKAMFLSIEKFLNEKYGEDTVKVALKDSYFNMREKILPHYHLIENAVAVMETLGVKPLVVPVRGGTDGARLSYMGLPCPNICTGGHNFHGRYEYIPVQSMEKTVEILLGIVQKYANFQK